MHPQLLTVIKADKLQDWTKEEWAKWYVEPKFDGARLIYHKGKFLSRTGKPLHNLDHIAAALEPLSESWTLDGEVYGEDWSTTMSVARSSKTEKAGNWLKFAVFDSLTNEEWEQQYCMYTLADRRDHLNTLWTPNNHSHLVPRVTVEDYEQFSIYHEDNLTAGCDGTVLKLKNSLYEFRRTKTWLKVKPVETFDCVVVGVKEGTGKYKGMLGALEIQPELGGPTSFCSGMTDEQRSLWWSPYYKPGCPAIIGKTIEVQARGVHKSGRLIEPRFIRIREDK
ncbi:MAG: hypothetical protein ACRCZI_05480 [Cetobacterium sp.]